MNIHTILKRQAPTIEGDTWFNSKPLKAEDLEGKVVLYDFWTYSCVNCQRTLPHLKEWWEKYKDKDFLLIGIHTPEFEFEKDPKNVERAIKDSQVGWPVVLDSDYINWRNFNNHYWPAKYLADKNGTIVYTHFGEGNYAETEKVIQMLLRGSGDKADMPSVEVEEHTHGNVCFISTPELYCGYQRGKLNHQQYVRDQEAEYKVPEEVEQDSIALSGTFLATAEYIQSAGQGATLLLHFRATEVNLVFHPVSEKATVTVTLDDKPVPSEIRGHDVSEGDEVTIQKPTLYNLLKGDNAVEGVLRIQAKEGQFQAYAFTFSGCTN